MHQSFVSTDPLGSGNSGAFNFSAFKARLKARGKVPAKSPGYPEAENNNMKQQLVVVLIKHMREGFEFLHVNKYI